jgi:hypothetical protein
MRSLLMNMLIPLAAVAATAIPTDPARAAEVPCPRVTAPVAAKAQPAAAPQALALVRLVPCLRKLEAL